MENQKKLLILGPAGTGKSSIILSIFGSVDPELILASPMEPTMGIESASYQWGNVQVGVFDLAGQELEHWMSNERDFIFPDTDELFIVFEYNHPIKKILEFMKQIGQVIDEYQIPLSNSYIFIHKIDRAKNKKEQEEYIKSVKDSLDKTFGYDRIRVFGTSLYPSYYKKFQFVMDWCLTALEISLLNMKKVKAIPVSDMLLRSLRTSGFISVSMEDDDLVDLPEMNPKGFNELNKIKKDMEMTEIDRMGD